MIKQIQLRGISRTPSDRMSEDGGLSESLNMYLDTAENAPVLVPKDVTEELGLPADLQAEHIFIHKTANYENYIVESDGSVFAYVQGKKLPVMELNSETINNISSVGNTIVIATNKRLVYALYRESSYVYLGDEIPRPAIEFRTVSNLYPDSITQELLLQHATGAYSPINALDVDAWNNAIEDLDANKTNENTMVLDALNKKIWGDINKKISDVKKERKFATPFFVRYAVRLYDLSYYHISEPILIGAGYDNLFDISATRTRTTNNGISTYITWRLSNIFTCIAHLKKWDTVGWEDIVNSIDIFFSTPLYFPNNEAKFSKLIMTSGGGTSQLVNNDYYDIKFKMSKNTEFESIEDEILSKSVFFKYASFTLAEIDELANGYDLGVHNGVLLEEVLESQDKLSESIFAKKVIASKLATFNNRLIINVLSQDYSEGFNELPSTNVALGAPGRSTTDGRFFAFYLSDGTKIIARNSSGNTYFYPYRVVLPGELRDETHVAAMFGLLFFPETSCKKVVICDEEGIARTVEMKAHPNLPYSYAFWGLSKTDLDLPYEEVNLSDFLADQMAVKQTNKLLISESSNPFNFPLTGVFEFQSKVLGIAIATTALSQGQFGQFPLYVFTEDGIWAMETASDGSFVSQKPLSREVCVNPDSICSIDNAVVFVTAKGVMMIQGSQVMNISPYMNGRHYIPNESAVNLIKNQEGFEQLESAIVDEEPFMTFMKKTKVTYDYAGQRLIFIAEDEAYQYIYKIDTQTWHKVAFDEIDLNTPINSYPECLVQASVSLNKLPIYIYAKSDPNISISTVESLLQDIPNKGPLRQAGIDLSIASNLHDFLSGKTDYVLVSEQGIADDIQNVLGYWGYDIDFYYGSSYEITIEYTDPDYPAEMIRLAEDLSVGFNDFYASLPTPSTTPNLLTAAGWKEFAKTKKVIFKNSDKTNGILETLGPEGLVPKTIDIQRIPVQVTHVYSLSTPLDVSTDQSTAKGILITRPFDLGEPDVYKSIKSIKIRGDFDKENVKYILQGSDNGRDFYTLTSLRGKSWKMFRIFILADLEPTERISWIDVDYEPRYQNKLR